MTTIAEIIKKACAQVTDEVVAKFDLERAKVADAARALYLQGVGCELLKEASPGAIAASAASAAARKHKSVPASFQKFEDSFKPSFFGGFPLEGLIGGPAKRCAMAEPEQPESVDLHVYVRRQDSADTPVTVITRSPEGLPVQTFNVSRSFRSARFLAIKAHSYTVSAPFGVAVSVSMGATK
jgi:hypothetical protein